MFYASNNINKSNSAFSNHQYRKTCLGLVAQAPILLPGLYIVGSTHLSPPLPKKKTLRICFGARQPRGLRYMMGRLRFMGATP